MIDPDLRAKIMERFPAYAWIADVPEIAQLLQEAIDSDLTPDTLAARIRATEWWRTRDEAARKWADIEATDPASATQQVNDAKAAVKNLAAQLGGNLDDETAGGLAWRYKREGWNERQLREAIAASSKPGGVPAMSVRDMASQYMLNLTPGQIEDYTRRVFTGELDQNALKGLFAQQASSAFPHLAEVINKGFAPRDYFSPYISMISQMTDINPADIDLVNDSKWSPIISYADKGALRPMTLGEAMRHVRGTSAFASSRRGKQEAAQFTMNIEQALGAR